jgi:predicted glycosyltransferase
MKHFGLHTQNVLGLRDILDSPEVTINRWQVEGAYDVIERFYARILVFGMQDVYDIAEKYQLPQNAAQKVFYCGYVSNLEHERNAYNIRARYLAGKPADTRLVAVMAGGGADGYHMMSTLIEAFPKVLEDQPSVLVVITGPFMPVELIADLERRAGNLPIHMLEAVTDSTSYISAADLVIAMADTHEREIGAEDSAALILRQSGQRTRARLFSEKRWVDMIDPDELTPEKLAQCISSHLMHPDGSKPGTLPNLSGAAVAARHTLAVLAPKKERVPTQPA